MLKPFKFTHVLYEDGDALGFIFAIVSLLPVCVLAPARRVLAAPTDLFPTHSIVLVGLFTLFVSRRDFRTLALTVGLLVNEILNNVLKRLIAQPRPDLLVNQVHVADGVAVSGIAPGHGMPSAHAQFMAFLASAVTGWIWHRWFVCSRLRWAGTAAVHLALVATVMSRVYLGYHTPAQVAVGSVLGYAMGCLHVLLCELVLVPSVFPRLARTALARTLQCRDTSRVQNVLRVEYYAATSSSTGGR